MFTCGRVIIVFKERKEHQIVTLVSLETSKGLLGKRTREFST
jgi:hypothetical protein